MTYPIRESDPSLIRPGVIQFASRAAFKLHFGFEAPAFDPKEPKKMWTTDPVRGNGINLPGSILYPKYEVPASDAHLEDGDPINPRWLATTLEATSIMAEVQEDTGQVFPLTLQFTNNAPGHKPVYGLSGRKAWRLGAQMVGDLLVAKNANGIGNPGHWAVDKKSTEVTLLEWISDVLFTDNVLPPVPVPIRDLLPTEMWAPGGLFDSERMVILKPVKPVEPGGDAGAQLDRIEKTLALVKGLLDALLLQKG